MTTTDLPLEAHRGSCHCGAVSFTVRLAANALIERGASNCTCSICTRNGYHVIRLKRKDVTFHSRFEDLVVYRFSAGSPIAHRFCGICGSSVGVDREGEDMQGINVRLLRDIDISNIRLKIGSYKDREPAYVPPNVPALSPAPDGKHAYPASCHCGATTYSVRTVALTQQEILRCNCSICVVNGYLFVYPKRSDVVWHTGKEALRTYRFNTKRGQHLFCATCGSSLVIDFDGSDQLSVNVRMFHDIDISTLLFKEYDGKNIR